MKILLRIPAIAAVLVAGALCAELPPAERAARDEAERLERAGQWPSAGWQWEQAMKFAEQAGDFDRAIGHGERAVTAWKQAPGAEGQYRQAFAIGVMSKLDLTQGRLTVGRERNVEAHRLVAARIREASGWDPVTGQKPPDGVPMELLEAWARMQRDTANWLDAQGRTVAAVELFTATEKSLRIAAGGGVTGFYHRKLISTRASMLKFLGDEERAISDLKRLVETRQPGGESVWAQRMNFAYFSSQFYGPKPEYLETMRGILREMQAAGRLDRDSRRIIAKMAYAYGETGANIADLGDVIAEARAAGAELDAIYAQRDLAVINAKMGRREGVEKALLDSLNEVRQRGVKRGEPTLYREYGNFLVNDGRPAEGLRMLKEAVRMTRAFGWTQHLPQLLADIASTQAQLGDLRGVAQTLSELDALLAGGELIPAREFLACCARARALLLLGRSAEAETAIARGRAVADRAGLNDYQRFALEWTKDVTPVETPAPEVAPRAGIADLQPVAVIATAPPGGTALARFRLSNAAVNAADGTLTFRGDGIRARMDAAAGTIIAQAGQPDGAASAAIPARVGAGEEILITIEATAAATDTGIRLAWKSAGATAHADCHIRLESADATAVAGATVANTSLAFENPFYAVHLHHPVRTDGTPRSFRILLSRPCRVEVLDARTGALLAVDADGDGTFRSRGDSLAADADADGFPDLPADATTHTGEIELLIFPLPGVGPTTSDTRIVLQTKTAAGWTSVAHDTLKPPR